MSAETKFKVGDTVLYKGSTATVTYAGRDSFGITVHNIVRAGIQFWCYETDLTAAPPVVTLEGLSTAVEKLASAVDRLIVELRYAPGGSGFAQAKASFDAQAQEHSLG